MSQVEISLGTVAKRRLEIQACIVEHSTLSEAEKILIRKRSPTTTERPLSENHITHCSNFVSPDRDMVAEEIESTSNKDPTDETSSPGVPENDNSSSSKRKNRKGKHVSEDLSISKSKKPSNRDNLDKEIDRDGDDDRDSETNSPPPSQSSSSQSSSSSSSKVSEKRRGKNRSEDLLSESAKGTDIEITGDDPTIDESNRKRHVKRTSDGKKAQSIPKSQQSPSVSATASAIPVPQSSPPVEHVKRSHRKTRSDKQPASRTKVKSNISTNSRASSLKDSLDIDFKAEEPILIDIATPELDQDNYLGEPPKAEVAYKIDNISKKNKKKKWYSTKGRSTKMPDSVLLGNVGYFIGYFG